MTALTINTRHVETNTFRTLELHADYACENSGHCCDHGWRISIPTDRVHSLRKQLLASGMNEGEFDRRIMATPETNNPLLGGVFLRNPRGGCTFVGGEPGCSTCTLQHQIGHESLPEICQTYPRLTVRTPAGVYMTLSYTCPTAAKLLLKENGLREVAPRRVYQYQPELIGVSIGDDQHAPDWVPAVHPEWEAFDYFWRWAIDFAARPDLPPAQALYALGFIVQAIEQQAPKLVTFDPLVAMLDGVAAQPSNDFIQLCSSATRYTELGVIYFDTLLKQVADIPAALQILWDPAARSVLRRDHLSREFDARIRVKIDDFQLIERNFVASRLYANPLAYRARRFRTGYFANVLSLIALRFSMLALCLERDQPLNEKICLDAAGVCDDLLLHMEAMQTKFIETLDKTVNTDMANLMRPALF